MTEIVIHKVVTDQPRAELVDLAGQLAGGLVVAEVRAGRGD